MRKTFLRSAIATAAVAVGLAAGAASATAAQPASAPPDIDFDELMAVLTPEQLMCLATNSTNIDPDDAAAVFGVLDECDIDIADLLAATGSGSSGSATGTSVEPLLSSLAAIGIDEMAEICITASVAVAPPTDDVSALAVLQECSVSLAEVVTLIGGGSVGGGGTITTQPASSGSDNPLVAVVAAELAKEFPKLNEEQLNCFAAAALEDMAAFASEDVTAIFGALEACGIPITDIM